VLNKTRKSFHFYISFICELAFDAGLTLLNGKQERNTIFNLVTANKCRQSYSCVSGFTHVEEERTQNCPCHSFYPW